MAEKKETAAAEQVAEKKAPAKKTTTKKTAATAEKKPAAKKTTAKKTADAAEKKAPAKKATTKKAAEAKAEAPAVEAVAEKKAPAKKAAKKEGLTIRLAKSLAGRLDNQIATAKSLGLRKIGDVTVQPDNAATRGKITVIGHMIEVTEA